MQKNKSGKITYWSWVCHADNSARCRDWTDVEVCGKKSKNKFKTREQAQRAAESHDCRFQEQNRCVVFKQTKSVKPKKKRYRFSKRISAPKWSIGPFKSVQQCLDDLYENKPFKFEEAIKFVQIHVVNKHNMKNIKLRLGSDYRSPVTFILTFDADSNEKYDR